ncbi:MAG: PrsW family intramembrane metalloprotease [Methanomassiliicoccales archaeon]|nr:MAG: PrsW family intramembrane metalloprotease [Methanomassiliicoccales archaeon]
MALSMLDIVLVLFAAVSPPILYALWIRNAETCDRETLPSVMRAFLLGAFFTLGLAIVIETVVLTVLYSDGGIFTRPFWSLDLKDPDMQLFIIACVVAPLVEEMTKGLGIFGMRARIRELEDGIVYGAAVGLGFAAFENILYEVDALSVGFSVFVGTAVARALTSTALHASASAILGLGLSRGLLGRPGRFHSIIPYYLLAVLLHGVFNLLAITGEITGSTVLYLIAVIAGLVLVQRTFGSLLNKVRMMDMECREGRSI